MDIALLKKLLFRSESVQLVKIQCQEVQGKSPDFRIFENSQEVGFCELKSPRDDDLAEEINNPAYQGIASVNKDDPTFNKLGRHLKKAANQFNSIDPNGDKIHILVVANHDDGADFSDIITTMCGFEWYGREKVKVNYEAAISVSEAVIPTVDLIIYINAHTEELNYWENPDRPELACQARQLAGL